MAFEDIDVINPKKPGLSKVPEDGILVSTRHLGNRKGGETRYIRIAIGIKLARSISLIQPKCRLRLLFGTGTDAGFIRVSVDNACGKFVAKRSKNGDYALTINSATAEGRFSLSFDPFDRRRIEAIRPQNGQPPHFVFKASAEMLAVDE